MSETRVSEVLARPARGVMQATPSWILTEMIDAFLYDLSERQFAVLVLFLALVASSAQAAVENKVGGGIFRNVPPVTQPVIDHPPVDKPVEGP